MLAASLLLVIIGSILSYCWWKRSPLSKFPNEFLFDWSLLRTLLFAKGINPQIAFFQRSSDLCSKHRSEGIIVLWIPQPLIIVFGEEAIKFFSNSSSFIDKPSLYNIFAFMGETTIFLSSGDRFRKLKSILKPAFHPNVIRHDIPVLNRHAKYLVQSLEETNGTVTQQIQEYLENHVLTAFLEASMGIKVDNEENKSKIRRVVQLIFRLMEITSYRLGKPWMMLDFIFKMTEEGRKLLNLSEELNSIMKEMLEEIKTNVLSRRASKNSDGLSSGENILHEKSMGELLIEQHLKDSSFDMDDVRSQLILISFAGYDTVSNALMWCFWLLGNHQDIQQKAYEEVMAFTNGDIEYEDGRNLVYLDCILKESLRLFPPGPLYARMSSKDTKFGNCMIPKGTTIVMNTFSLHRNPELHSNPDDFIPERFFEGGSSVKPWTHIPFAEGVRACLGKHVAMIEMKIFLSHVLRKFKILSLDHPEDVQLIYEILLRCEKPLRMQFIPRLL